MAASIGKGQVFAATEQVTNTKLHNLVDNATISGIVTGELSATAGIVRTQLAALASAKIIIGSAANVPTDLAITGDVTLTNAGATTVTDLTIASEAEGDILYRNATVWARLAKGSAGQILSQNSGATAPEWAEVSQVEAATGSVEVIAADTEVASITTGTYTKYKEIEIGRNGTYSIYFELRSGDASTAYGRVYKGGAAVGTERSTTETTYQPYAEDIALVAGDLIQLYAKNNGTNETRIRNFKVKADRQFRFIVQQDS